MLSTDYLTNGAKHQYFNYSWEYEWECRKQLGVECTITYNNIAITYNNIESLI